jgi:hypothetical protein
MKPRIFVLKIQVGHPSTSGLLQPPIVFGAMPHLFARSCHELNYVQDNVPVLLYYKDSGAAYARCFPPFRPLCDSDSDAWGLDAVFIA